MADSTLHFALGLAVGTCALIPSLIKKIRSEEKTSQAVNKLIITSYGLALFAITPNLLRHSGIPDFFCSGWWMNLFLFHPLLDKIKPGGALMGELLIVLFFVMHYSIILACLLKARSRSN
ncbi:MAG: hypothetical protein PHR77_19855 [Kiritimatiellae bacterium]|nr:hypothetical protein [Kiritimatiellia bacterium]MDD5520342.1 hypothetical protein [Kiritimatiellia bacterium]